MTPPIEIHDVPWAPQPNVLRVHPVPPPEHGPVTSVMALVFDAAGHLLLTRVAARGWDLPGGHVEDGETPDRAVVRELLEETGVALADGEALVPAGALTLHVDAPCPDGYRYPHPDSAQLAYRARLPRLTPDVAPQPGTECVEAAWVPLEQVATLTGPRVWHHLLTPAGAGPVPDTLTVNQPWDGTYEDGAAPRPGYATALGYVIQGADDGPGVVWALLSQPKMTELATGSAGTVADARTALADAATALGR